MKLLLAVVHLRKNKMEVISEDRRGSRRRIVVNWLNKELTNSPPVFWPEMIEGEHEVAIEHELSESTGKNILLK